MSRPSSHAPSPTPGTLTRREFLLWSALAGAGAALVPGELRDAPPLRLGLVGLDGRGLALLELCAGTPGLLPAALCDLRPAALRRAVDRLAGTSAAPSLTTRAADLAADPTVDALVLAVPGRAVPAVAEPLLRTGRPLLLARPAGLPREAAEALARRAARSDAGVGLLPRLDWGPTPAPAAGSVAGLVRGLALDGPATPRLGRLVVSRPADPDATTGPRGAALPLPPWAHLLDEADFLRHALELGGGEPQVRASVTGMAPDGARELRAALRWPGDGDRPARHLDVLLRRLPRPDAAATAEIEMTAAGGRLRLHGRDDGTAAGDAARGELRRTARRGPTGVAPGRDRPRPETTLRLPLASALATARFLDGLAAALGHPGVTTLL